MKKVLLFSIMMTCALFCAAQSVDYRPLVQEGVKWVYCYDNVVNNNSEPNYELYTMEFSGTTELNGKTYHNCYHYTNSKLDPLAEVPVAWVREEGKRVYAVFNGEFTCKDAVYIGGKSLLKKVMTSKRRVNTWFMTSTTWRPMRRTSRLKALPWALKMWFHSATGKPTGTIWSLPRGSRRYRHRPD